MSYRPTCRVRAPVATRSGYGGMSRDIVRHLIEYDKYNVDGLEVEWIRSMTRLHSIDPGVWVFFSFFFE